MKRNVLVLLCISFLMSGCGDVDWFPDTQTNNSNVNTSTSPKLTMAYSPAAILAGDAGSTLTFTITNASGNPAKSGLTFQDKLDTALKVSDLKTNCGGTAEISTHNYIIFSGGQLNAGTATCTITATIKSQLGGLFTNGSGDISGLGGGLVSAVTDQTLKVSQTDTSGDVVAPGDGVTAVEKSSDQNVKTYNVSVTVTNNSDVVADVIVTLLAVDADGNALNNGAYDISVDLEDLIAAKSSKTIDPVPVEVPISLNVKNWRIRQVTKR